jgi:beta-carotene 3-hydroxylase
MNMLVNILIILFSFISMEGVAWLTHKYLMHGCLWFLHQDHHHKDHAGFLERNDFFFLIFALPGIASPLAGFYFAIPILVWIGTGISIYGACYFFVHDIYIHQRFKILRGSDNRYLKAIRRAHKMHHKHIDKEYGECFGMLWVPFKYFLESKNSHLLQNDN